ncbi:hypothetical protein C0993_009644 [Termitomyces sp. T159_Od127]|nr:hypothetical protein C0993_009644 [Termitomyces sp. T159_Od127]
MAREIWELKSEVRSVQLKQDDMAQAQSKLTDQVVSLDQRLCTTQQALLVQGREEKIRSRVIELKSQIGSLRISLLFPTEPQRKLEIQGLLDGLTAELDAKSTELTSASDHFASVIGVPPEAATQLAP